jgi:hypothetical protein
MARRGLRGIAAVRPGGYPVFLVASFGRIETKTFFCR